MRTDTFDYDLPNELIAQEPLRERDASRLMVLERATGRVSHRFFRDLPALVGTGDCLVLNTTRVMPARLIGRKRPSGGRVELLLLEAEDDTWRAMARGAGLRPGVEVAFASGLSAIVLEGPREGIVRVRLSAPGDVHDAIHASGVVPMPPYVKHELRDPERYQTVYSLAETSSAAPTAGLHFTPRLLDLVQQAGATIARLELSVGMDTFVPVRAENVLDHKMHSERFTLDEACARAVNGAGDARRRVVAVGTTSARVLETCALPRGGVAARNGATDLFITPGYEFKAVDALITNFHFPRSTLLMMVCAFAGTERVLSAYAEAVAMRYRFYSFGDAMLVT